MGEMFEGYKKSRKVSSVKLLVVVVGIGALVGGAFLAHYGRVRFNAALKVAQHDESERTWLRATATNLVELGRTVDMAKKERIAILEQGTKSKQDQERYNAADALVEQRTQVYNEAARPYNLRRLAYKGPWPEGPPAPTMFPLQ